MTVVGLLAVWDLRGGGLEYNGADSGASPQQRHLIKYLSISWPTCLLHIDSPSTVPLTMDLAVDLTVDLTIDLAAVYAGVDDGIRTGVCNWGFHRDLRQSPRWGLQWSPQLKLW